jgi:hypothetical protein
MKNIGTVYSIALGILLCSMIGVSSLEAQSSQLENSSVKLSGSRFKAEEIVAKANVICVGEIVQIGPPLTRAAAQASYPGVKIQISQCLKGDLSSPALIEIVVAKEPNVTEEAPKAGTTYIFFIKQTTSWNMVLKLLPATDDNIAKVKAMIAAAPAGK